MSCPYYLCMMNDLFLSTQHLEYSLYADCDLENSSHNLDVVKSFEALKCTWIKLLEESGVPAICLSTDLCSKSGSRLEPP